MTERTHRRNFFQSLGPAIIIAAVVLGPGSILTSSKVGCQYGYSMLWVLGFAGLLMIGMTALASRLGMTFSQSVCSELADRLGRPFAAFVGVTMFLIVICFQSSNNIAVLASFESLFESTETASENQAGSWVVRSAILIALNGIIVAAFYGFKQLYKPLERIMIVAVLLMIIAFAANLVFAKPVLSSVLGGLIPRLSFAENSSWLPSLVEGKVIDPFWAMQGLFATTFSIAAAFYQSYLVREKKWGLERVRDGLVDSITGIGALVVVSAMIMVTSATVLHGVISPDELRSAADVASQLEPLFGSSANLLFLAGILAAALSSFLVNAMVGGTLLADGLGLGSSMDEKWPKRLTVVALSFGMAVAIWSTSGGGSTVSLIIFAQALTVFGGPILAISLIFLAWGQRDDSTRRIPRWILAIAVVGGLVTLVLAVRTAWRLFLQLS